MVCNPLLILMGLLGILVGLLELQSHFQRKRHIKVLERLRYYLGDQPADKFKSR